MEDVPTVQLDTRFGAQATHPTNGTIRVLVGVWEQAALRFVFALRFQARQAVLFAAEAITRVATRQLLSAT